jgi:uncharacterized protein YqgC (DUF456 family)
MKANLEIGKWTLIGAGIGTVIGLAVDYFRFGISVGAASGIALGLYITRRKIKNESI